MDFIINVFRLPYTYYIWHLCILIWWFGRFHHHKSHMHSYLCIYSYISQIALRVTICICLPSVSWELMAAYIVKLLVYSKRHS